MNIKLKRVFFIGISAVVAIAAIVGCGGGGGGGSNESQSTANESMLQKTAFAGYQRSRLTFSNPYANVPAQCYIETSGGTQNACLFCHTNAPARALLGNNNPQAGLNPLTGDLQVTYSFTPASALAPNPNINRWENTLFPERLDDAIKKMGIDMTKWNPQEWVAQDNWKEAYKKRLGDPKEWDSGYSGGFRLFPGLDPNDLPAQSDGYVRSQNPKNGYFADANGYITGWRAVNFMPYGIFTPHTGSVSGIYIRLPKIFMQDANGNYSLEIYSKNLELLEKAIQDRPSSGEKTYLGAAAAIELKRGSYPIGTEFAHPLHYVDVRADGSDLSISPYPGTRSRRVKEIRYMYKWRGYDAGEMSVKEENAPIYLNETDGWVDNGAGWYLSAYIEDKEGKLRAQSSEELFSCIGCHSDQYGYEPAHFTSGTGNTIDSTWAFPRKFEGALGWREMDYLAYKFDKNAKANQTQGSAHRGDPINRSTGKGEYRYFLEHVVGVSLYGVMPRSIESFLKEKITTTNGYSTSWIEVDTSSPEKLLESQRVRQKLMREFTAKKAYLDADGYIVGAMLYPTLDESMAGITGYKKVVATQRYTLGKEVFSETPFTFKYYRTDKNAYTHIDDKTPYKQGEVITDRPFNHEESITKGAGVVDTLIDPKLSFEDGGTYNAEYMPLFRSPLSFE